VALDFEPRVTLYSSSIGSNHFIKKCGIDSRTCDLDIDSKSHTVFSADFGRHC
jgi:ribosomal protein L31